MEVAVNGSVAYEEADTVEAESAVLWDVEVAVDRTVCGNGHNAFQQGLVCLIGDGDFCCVRAWQSQQVVTLFTQDGLPVDRVTGAIHRALREKVGSKAFGALGIE